MAIVHVQNPNDPNDVKVFEQPDGMPQQTFIENVASYFDKQPKPDPKPTAVDDALAVLKEGVQGNSSFPEAGKAARTLIDTAQPHVQKFFSDPKKAAGQITELFSGLDMTNLEQYKDMPFKEVVALGIMNRGGGKVKSKVGRSFFSTKALERAAAQGDKSADILIDMSVDDFLKLAKGIPAGSSTDKAVKVDKLVKEGKQFDTIPTLGFTHDGNGTAKAISHEGRHRAKRLKEEGVSTIPVILESKSSGKGDKVRWLSQDGGMDTITGAWPKVIKGEEGGSIAFPVKDMRTSRGVANAK